MSQPDIVNSIVKGRMVKHSHGSEDARRVCLDAVHLSCLGDRKGWTANHDTGCYCHDIMRVSKYTVPQQELAKKQI